MYPRNLTHLLLSNRTSKFLTKYVHPSIPDINVDRSNPDIVRQYIQEQDVIRRVTEEHGPEILKGNAVTAVSATDYPNLSRPIHTDDPDLPVLRKIGRSVRRLVTRWFS